MRVHLSVSLALKVAAALLLIGLIAGLSLASLGPVAAETATGLTKRW
ncbi:hypothetical protein [Amycolatopsis sp. TRM77291]